MFSSAFFPGRHFIATMLVLSLFIPSCKEPPAPAAETAAPPSGPGFVQLPAERSGVDFSNPIHENSALNYFNYPYIYTGGGVAVGDVNGDGLPDLFFTANMEPNRLYLNKGNLHFEDISREAGISGKKGWSTGCAMLDINDDGFLDIYVCYSGPLPPDRRRNELFINDGTGHFTESAARYGLDDPGFSTQIYPFDYDHDGDMDLYLLSHRSDFKNSSKVLAPRPDRGPDEYDTDKLFRRNEDGSFTNVTAEAGLINRGFGLSALFMDFNGDGYNDIYVANDYLEPDNLYINDGKGHFRDRCNDLLQHISFYSMGSDAADINNDGLEDFYVLDMAAPGHTRSKQVMAGMDSKGFRELIDYGYNYQYMINTLQLNRGGGHFSEIAQLAGLDKTDWSWAPLFMDFDLDGRRDVFVSNGIKYDVTDNDFKNWLHREVARKGPGLPFDEVMKKMPSTGLSNFFMRNEGQLRFRKMNENWGLTATQNSNGAAWADLDGDGDTDLITNNVDKKAGIFINQAEKNGNHYLKIKFEGPPGNRWGAGAEITLQIGDEKRSEQFRWVRGYQSSCEPVMHFGLGSHVQVDELALRWPDGRISRMQKVPADATILLRWSGAGNPAEKNEDTKLFVPGGDRGIDFVHREKEYDDYARELLLPHKMSQSGPHIARGDVNGDGLDDLFFCAAAGEPGALFVQDPEGHFARISGPWEQDRGSEDLYALFFDADSDGDPDLYVCSGSNEFEEGDPRLRDRLYLNNGKGAFGKSGKMLPPVATASRVAVAADWDGDGDEDLFVGGQVLPGRYPFSPRSYLLRNEGGQFIDATAELAPELEKPGMISDAAFADFDGDGDPDLLLAGEWTPLRLFANAGGRFIEQSADAGLSKSNGWWCSLKVADLDGDGDPDIVAGNIGENNKFHPSEEKPLHVYAYDFDHNGSLDIVLSKTLKNMERVPVRGRQCSSEQMPFIKEKFPSYRSFATADLEEIYTPEELDSALHLEAYTFSSRLWINDGKGHFEARKLPVEAQVSPVYGIVARDLNADGHIDLIVAGNRYGSEVETPRYDAGWGVVLLGDGRGGFEALDAQESGFYAGGNLHSLTDVYLPGSRTLLIISAVNNAPPGIFQLKAEKIP